MKQKILTYVGNGALIVGAVIGLYVLVDSYLIRRNLPAGTCPITDNKPWIYTAIVLFGISFIVSFFDTGKKQRNN